MASYELVFKKSVTNDPRGIPKKDVARILKRIGTFRDDPRGEGYVKLSVQERYRVRQGIYRIMYEIRENELIVMIVKVSHRSASYQSR